MPARQVLRYHGQVKRILASDKFYVTAVLTGGKDDWTTTTLKPQATTNPGTKDLPYVYFGKIKDWKGFEQFRKFQYPSRYYVLVPESSADGQQISWRSTGLGGDYVKVSPLEPDTTQYVVDISPDFESEEPEPSSTPGSSNAPPERPGMDFCTIM
jgi:hypothetical protein